MRVVMDILGHAQLSQTVAIYLHTPPELAVGRSSGPPGRCGRRPPDTHRGGAIADGTPLGRRNHVYETVISGDRTTSYRRAPRGWSSGGYHSWHHHPLRLGGNRRSRRARRQGLEPRTR